MVDTQQHEHIYRCVMAPVRLFSAESKSLVRKTHLCLTMRFRLDRLTQAAKELSEVTGQECIPCQADVRQPKTLQDAVATTIQKFGKIDFVICGG